jgi:hypothetical protein
MNLSTEEYERRKKVWDNIKNLVKSEQEELFRIIKQSGVEYSENTNGIFFDVAKLEQPIFEKICKFLDFCQQNRVNFDERDKALENFRQGV